MRAARDAHQPPPAPSWKRFESVRPLARLDLKHNTRNWYTIPSEAQPK
jgi:hypothetical protein